MIHASEAATRVRCGAIARVTQRLPICRDHVRIEFEIANFPPSSPGQFLQLRCDRDAERPARLVPWPSDGFPSLSRSNMCETRAWLRRPFSIADRSDTAPDRALLVIISRAVGRGTRFLEQLSPGRELDCTGPLGRGFRLPDRPSRVALVGGGVGIPPLLYLARALHESGHRDVTAIFGATSRDLLPLALTREPERDGEPAPCVVLPGGAPFACTITSDDGTIGLRGRVTDGLLRWQSGHRSGDDAIVYACGPEPMLAAVARHTRRAGVACQLCVERHMGCGLGTCLSCVIRVRDSQAPGQWRWALTCTDGPVFDRDDPLDYAAADRA